MKKAKSILGQNKINVKRIDLLDEENQKQARDIEFTRQIFFLLDLNQIGFNKLIYFSRKIIEEEYKKNEKECEEYDISQSESSEESESPHNDAANGGSAIKPKFRSTRKSLFDFPQQFN